MYITLSSHRALGNPMHTEQKDSLIYRAYSITSNCWITW